MKSRSNPHHPRAWMPALLVGWAVITVLLAVLLDDGGQVSIPSPAPQDAVGPPSSPDPPSDGSNNDRGGDAGAPDDARDDVDTAVAEPLPDAPFNPGWVGGACSRADDCDFPGAVCLSPLEGWPGGMCSRACTGACGKRRGDVYSDTACITDPTGAPGAVCVPRCALNLSPSGCRPGYACVMLRPLGGADGSERLTCVPQPEGPPPDTACTQALKDMGLHFGRPSIGQAETHVGGARAACTLDTPVLLSSPVHHVDWREHGRRMAENLLVSCEMAAGVERLSRILDALAVVEVEHVGTYNCRGVAGAPRLSAHAHGRAIDIRRFERSGLPTVDVAQHWNGKDPERRRFLRAFVERARAEGGFARVLTPDSDRRHADHLHLEL